MNPNPVPHPPEARLDGSSLGMPVAHSFRLTIRLAGNRRMVMSGRWSAQPNGPDAWVKRSIRAAIAGFKTRFTGSLQSVFRALVHDANQAARGFLVSLISPFVACIHAAQSSMEPAVCRSEKSRIRSVK